MTRCWLLTLIILMCVASTFIFGQEAQQATDERLQHPDILYFNTERAPLKGMVLEETDTDVLFEVLNLQTKAKGTIRISRTEIQRIEYFEDYCITRANDLLSEKKYEEARSWFTRASNHIAALPPDSPRKVTLEKVKKGLRQIDFMRAADLNAAGRPDEALVIYEELYKAEKDWPELQKAISDTICGMAAALQGKGKYDEAHALIRRLLNLYPEDPGGKVYEAGIRKHYETVRAKSLSLLAQAQKLADARQYKEAIATCLAALNTDPNTPGVRELLSQCRSKYQVLRYGDYEFPASLHPLVASKMAEKRIAQLLFDGLVDRSDRLESDEYYARLAVKHTASDDNLTHTFILAPGLRWSDGQALTSADVAFTIRCLQNEQGDGYNKSWASWIKSVETPDPLTVKITFTRPPCRPLAHLAFKVVPRHKFSDEVPRRRCEFSQAPVGCGPFVLSELTSEEQIVLKRNEQFRLYRSEGKPYLSEVSLKRYYDRVTAFTDFTRGDLELLTQLEPLQVDQLRKLGESKFVVKSHATRTVYFLAMNFRRKIFQEYDMRKAIISAIDRHKILVQHFRGEQEGGQGHRVISGPFPTGTWAYNDGQNPNMPVPDYPFAPELARNLVEGLKQRGLGPLLDITLKFPADDLKVERACVEIRNQLNDVGIPVRAEKRLENVLHDDLYGRGDFDLAYASYSFDDTMDVSPLFDFEQIGPYRANFSAYKNPDLNALFAEIRKSPDPQRVKDLTWEVHAVVARDLAIIPLWQLDNYVAFKSTVQGAKVHPYYLFGSPEEWRIAEQ